MKLYWTTQALAIVGNNPRLIAIAEKMATRAGKAHVSHSLATRVFFSVAGGAK